VDGGLRAFDEWMRGGALLGFSLTLVLLGVVLAPALVLVHELGHAAVALARTEGLVAVRVGRSPASWRRRFGRLQLELSILPARNEPAGLAKIHARLGSGSRVALALAGPLAQAIAGVLIAIVGTRIHFLPLTLSGGLCVLEAAANLIPREKHGVRSDGAYLGDALREFRGAGGRGASDSAAERLERELSDIRSRWQVIVSDERSPIRTQQRGRLLTAAHIALGHNDSGSEPARSLWWVSFSAWCWRHVERGDLSRIREAVLDAIHEATLSGAVEPDLTAHAAVSHAARNDLSLASPGDDDEARRRHFERGYELLLGHARPTDIPQEHWEFAYRYGIALHDIEQARAPDALGA
jgi:hypothetical protein